MTYSASPILTGNSIAARNLLLSLLGSLLEAVPQLTVAIASSDLEPVYPEGQVYERLSAKFGTGTNWFLSIQELITLLEDQPYGFETLRFCAFQHGTIEVQSPSYPPKLAGDMEGEYDKIRSEKNLIFEYEIFDFTEVSFQSTEVKLWENFKVVLETFVPGGLPG